MLKVIQSWLYRYLGDEEALLLALIIVFGLLAFWAFGSILAPFVVSILISYILQGPVNRLVARGLSRMSAVGITYMGFVGLLVGSGLFIIPLILSQITAVVADLPEILRRGEATLKSAVESSSDYVGEELLSEAFAQLNQVVLAYGEKLVSYSLGQIPGLLTLIVYGVLVLILVFFMLKDWHLLGDGLRGFLPTRRGAMRLIWNEMDQQFANYLRGKALEIFIVAVASYLVFLLFGLRYSLLLAVLVGFSVLIPYVGAFAVTVPVALVAIFQWGAAPVTYYLIAAYVLLQILDGNVLVPLIFSEAVNLHPVYIILAILFFGGIWGLWGVFFAIPLATLIKALISAWPVCEADEVTSPVGTQ